jgi:hypothetical protein
MRTFSCFITDGRYAVPTLDFLVVADERRAQEIALRRLMESPHHLAVEVVENGHKVYSGRREPQSLG